MVPQIASPSFRESVLPSDRIAVEEIVASSGFFRPDEIAVAVELVDDRLNDPKHSTYRFVFAESDGVVQGYACFGLIPCTLTSYDIYWIAVRESARGSGLGGEILRRAEAQIAESGGLRSYIETSGKAQYEPSRGFYLKCGYREAANLADYYAPGDSKLIYEKVLLPA